MSVQVVECLGIFKPGEIMLPTDSSPPRTPSTSESNSTLFKYKDLKVISSSRDGWSPARIRAANAEVWAFQDAADQVEDEESAAWANADEGPEPDATDEDIRIYTKIEDGEYRYWGVKDLDETMEEFWARIDPDNTSERIANQEGSLPAPAEFTPSKSPSPRPRTASRLERSQETPEGNPKHRVTKPAVVTPGSRKGIRKSLTGNIEGRYSEIYEQVQDISNSSTKEPTVVTNVFGTRWLDQAERSQTISGVNRSMFNPSTTKTAARGRPRKIQSGIVHSASSNPADWPTSTREDPPKRKRGRPAKENFPTKSQELNRSYGSNEKQKRPKAESKAKVTKPKPKNGRPIAPSFHKMRTRARGPAENLQRF